MMPTLFTHDAHVLYARCLTHDAYKCFRCIFSTCCIAMMAVWRSLSPTKFYCFPDPQNPLRATSVANFCKNASRVSFGDKAYCTSERPPKAGDRVLGCIMLGSGLGARSDGGGARFARLGLVGRWTAVGLASLASARPEIVDLGNENVVKFCQKVARIRKAYTRTPLPKRSLYHM